jgi:hypothetical protein
MLRGMVLALATLTMSTLAWAQETPGEAMTLDRLDLLILAVDGDAERSADGGVWQFSIVDIPVSVVTDESNDRMRILVPINYVEGTDPELLMRMMQANFDTALDARYAIAQGILWSTFIHPLSPLTDDQFLSGAGQAVNLAATFGTTYSSGGLTFGGGDSEGILERELIEELLKRGEEI